VGIGRVGIDPQDETQLTKNTWMSTITWCSGFCPLKDSTWHEAEKSSNPSMNIQDAVFKKMPFKSNSPPLFFRDFSCSTKLVGLEFRERKILPSIPAGLINFQVTLCH